MSEFSNIDEQFRKGQADWEGQPDEATWHRLSDRLKDQKTNSFTRKRRLYRVASAACVTLLLSVAVYMFNNSFQLSGTHAQNTDAAIPAQDAKIKGKTSDEIVRGKANESLEKLKVDIDEDITISRSARTSNASTSDDLKTDNKVADLYDSSASGEDVVIQSKVAASSGSIATVKDNSKGIASARYDEEETTEPAEAFDLNYDDENEAGKILDEVVIRENDADVVADEEMPVLTETAVANQMNIAYRKEEHQESLSKKDKYEEKRNKAGNNQSAVNSGMAEKAAGYGAEQIESSTGEATAYTSTQVLVYIPRASQYDCPFVGIMIANNQHTMELCLDSKKSSKSITTPLANESIIQLLAGYDRNELRRLAALAKDGPCLPSSNNIQFTFRTGTTLSYSDEIIQIPMQEFCLPEEAKELVRKLKVLAE